MSGVPDCVSQGRAVAPRRDAAQGRCTRSGNSTLSEEVLSWMGGYVTPGRLGPLTRLWTSWPLDGRSGIEDLGLGRRANGKPFNGASQSWHRPERHDRTAKQARQVRKRQRHAKVASFLDQWHDSRAAAHHAQGRVSPTLDDSSCCNHEFAARGQRGSPPPHQGRECPTGS